LELKVIAPKIDFATEQHYNKQILLLATVNKFRPFTIFDKIEKTSESFPFKKGFKFLTNLNRDSFSFFAQNTVK